MCEKCKELLKCPVNEKRKSVIEDKDGVKTEMVLDHYPDHIKVFIHSEFTDENGRWNNIPFHITHCPFCGELLKGADT